MNYEISIFKKTSLIFFSFLLFTFVLHIPAAHAQAVDYSTYMRVVDHININGEINDLIVRENLAFVAVEQELQVWNIENLLAAELIGSFSYDFELAVLALHNDIILISTQYNGLLAVDISDPSAMVELSRIDLPGIDKLIAIVGDYAILESISTLFNVIDISDPTNLTRASYTDLPTSSIDSICLNGDVAYATGPNGGFMILDIGNMPDLGLINYFPEYYDGNSSGSVSIVGDLLYLSAMAILHMWDISDPGNPQLLATQPGYTREEFFAYGSDQMFSALYDHVRSYDITDPLVPVLLGEILVSGSGGDLHVMGDKILMEVDSPELAILGNLENPAVPMLDEIQLPERCHGFEVSGDKAALALSSGRMAVVNLSDPENLILEEILDFDTNNHLGVAAGPDLVLVADPDFGFWVVDWTDISNLVVVGSYQVPDGLADLKLQGNLALISVAGLGLEIVDLQDPSNPVHLSEWSGAGYYDFSVRNLYVDDDIVLVNFAYFDHFLTHLIAVIDISDPANIEVLPFMGGNISQAVFRDKVLVQLPSWYGHSIEIISMVDPSNPQLIATVSSPFESPKAFGLDGQFLYIGEAGQTVSVFDLSNPELPVPVGSFSGNFSIGILEDVLYLSKSFYESQTSVFRSFPKHLNGLSSVITPGPEGAGPSPFISKLHCYPNPFNPQITVSFNTDQPQRVRVAVWDIRGHLIAELADHHYEAGEHSIEWQGRDSLGRTVPSGEYFFRVEMGDQVETRKVMLVR